MKDNLKLWESVEKTDPKDTKLVGFGRKFTAIDAYAQFRNATKAFGAYGKGWWVEKEEYLVPYEGLMLYTATFCYLTADSDAVNNFPIHSTMLTHNLKSGKIDDEIGKKIATDALTKGLSMLGFNADIFLGKFEDSRYVAEMKEEFKQSNTKPQNNSNRPPVVQQTKPQASKPTQQDRKTEQVADKIGGKVVNNNNSQPATDRQMSIVKKIMASSNISNEDKKVYKDKITTGMLTFKDADYVMNVLGKKAKAIKKIVAEAEKLKVVDEAGGNKLRSGLVQLIQEDIDSINDLTHSKLTELVKEVGV